MKALQPTVLGHDERSKGPLNRSARSIGFKPVEYSLGSRAKTIDALLRELKSDLLRIWIPLVAGLPCWSRCLSVEIQGYRDSIPVAAATRTHAAVPSVPNPEWQTIDTPDGNRKPPRESREKEKATPDMSDSGAGYRSSKLQAEVGARRVDELI